MRTTVAELSRARKALFMTHLALGDYLYQRTFLKQIRQQYPQLQLDIWFDDFRKQKKSWHQGRTSLLSGWLQQEPFITNIYAQSRSEAHRAEQVARAKAEKYDVVFFIANTRSTVFSRYAREIGGNKAWCAGAVSAGGWQWLNRFRYRHCDALYIRENSHKPMPILQQYQRAFSTFSPLEDVKTLEPLDLDAAIVKATQSMLTQWHQQHSTSRVLLINGISTTSKRDYPDEKLSDVLIKMASACSDTLFVINTPPHRLAGIKKLADVLVQKHQVKCEVFTATQGITELAAMVAGVDGVLSVETAIIHFAAATNTPFVALMREKTAHWCPPQSLCTLYSPGHVSELSSALISKVCLKYLI